jgi:hypothetical protein
MKTVVICSSANFYKQAVALQAKLSARGYKIVIPHNAEVMKRRNDFDASHYRTWLTDPGAYPEKTALMQKHFAAIAAGDAVLVVNETKHGAANYIGGNVLMEMALAFYLQKPIYLLHEIPKESAFLEEIIGLNPIALHGDSAAFKF